MARRLAAELRAQGHPCPETAATLLAERGRLRLDRASFAARLGLEPAMLAAIEDGRPQLVDGPRAPGTV